MDLEARLTELAGLVGDPEMIFAFGRLYVRTQHELEAMRVAGMDRQEVAVIGRRLQDILMAEAPIVEADRRRFVAERRAAAEAAAMN